MKAVLAEVFFPEAVVVNRRGKIVEIRVMVLRSIVLDPGIQRQEFVPADGGPSSLVICHPACVPHRKTGNNDDSTMCMRLACASYDLEARLPAISSVVIGPVFPAISLVPARMRTTFGRKAPVQRSLVAGEFFFEVGESVRRPSPWSRRRKSGAALTLGRLTQLSWAIACSLRLDPQC